MNPSIIFLNGPENNEKRALISNLKAQFKENACVVINRKELIRMFNAEHETPEESYEWIVAKVLKNILNNGVIVLFDAFLPSRRMQQYVQQMNGLPCYWIGVFFKEYSQDFYDFSVQLKGEGQLDLSEFPFLDKIASTISFIGSGSRGGITSQEGAEQIYEYVTNNEPSCFAAFRSVEVTARKREVKASERGEQDVQEEPVVEKYVPQTEEEKREYKERKFRSLKNKYTKIENEEGEEGFGDAAAETKSEERREARGGRSFGGARGGKTGFKGRSGGRGEKRAGGRGGFGAKRFDDKKFGDSKFGERKFGNRNIDRKPREEGATEGGVGEERGFGRFGDKPRFGGRAGSRDGASRFSNRGGRGFADRKPREEFGSAQEGSREERGGFRRFGDKPRFGGRSDREGKSEFGSKRFGDKKFGDRKFGERKFGDRKFGDRNGDRKPKEDFGASEGGEERRFKKFGDRPRLDKPRFGNRRPGARSGGRAPRRK